MMTGNSHFYILTVSKSLLIVLGTSPCHSPQTANCSKCAPLLVKGKNALDKRSLLAGLVLSVLRKAASVLTSHMVVFADRMPVAPCVIRPCKAGHPSHIRRYDRQLLTRAYVRRCSSRPLRSGVRSLKESLYVRIRATIRDCERGSK